MTAKIIPMQGNSLVRYEAMVAAINECHHIDEIKQIHNQAAALEAAARVAMNVEAERKLIEIRVRAERRGGELMKAMQRAPTASGGDVKSESARQGGGPISEYRASIERAGIPERTAQRWQELAEVPIKKFEEQLAAVKPSARSIVNSTKDKKAGKARRPYVEDEPDVEPEEAEDEENYRTAFFLRAHEAIRFAVYKRGPVNREMVARARACAEAWTQLARKLEAAL